MIGNDFYESHLDLDDAALYKINCFDWEEEFKSIFKGGGFDVVIGNPPYVQIQGMERELKEGYKEANYKNYISTGDIYQLFFEKGLDVLKIGGIVGMITSNKWMRAGYGAITRDYFYRNANVNGVIDLGGGRFKGATVDTNIILYSKKDDEIKINEPREFKAIKFYDDLINLKDLEFKNDIVIANHDKEWIIMNNLENGIFEKINKHKLLKDWDIKINSGIKTGFNEAFFIDEETKNNLIKEDSKSADLIKPLLKGRDMRRYYCIHNNLYLINTHNGIKEKNIPPINIKDYPAIKKHLDKYYKQLEKRQDKGITPYNLRNCAYLSSFSNINIVWQRITDRNKFVVSNEGEYILDSMAFISGLNSREKAYYILGVLNSNLVYFWIRHNVHEYGQTGFRLSNQYVEIIPIPEPDKDTESKLVNLVDNIIDLNKKLSSEKNPNTIDILNSRIETIDRKINSIVYELYNLNSQEIAIIEGDN
ncbi:Eco57I restriction-modification methylase domain-containing protein [Brachyspira pilosicoli]|uniref:Eco57I restriction-modification methylase domain-containing protein n=1 Tax=Brachyspira pilosicoli TaxID=52584 RepID=UPI0012F491EC|nr:Eco57I restriction-modification methylase domain-containing protein [Brachyspira pilosicoli]